MKNIPNKTGSKTNRKQETPMDQTPKMKKQPGYNDTHPDPEKKSKYTHPKDSSNRSFQKSDPSSKSYLYDDDSYDEESFEEEE